MKKIVAILTILLIAITFSRLPPNTVQAQNLGSGTVKQVITQEIGSTSIVNENNGSTLYSDKGNEIWTGTLSGNSTDSMKYMDWPNSSAAFYGSNVFMGSFNGSKPGSISGVYGGTYDGISNKATESWSAGSGGLAGLQIVMRLTIQSRTCLNAGCASLVGEGSYTDTSVTWGTIPTPEFSNLVLPIILSLFASSVCFTMLRRKKAN